MQPQVMVDDDISSQKHISENNDKVTNDLHDADIIAIEEKRATESNDNERKDESKVEDHPIHDHSPAKHIITSEMEAKARIAEKRREMKEKMEREAELERQRLVSNLWLNRLKLYYKENGNYCIFKIYTHLQIEILGRNRALGGRKKAQRGRGGEEGYGRSRKTGR